MFSIEATDQVFFSTFPAFMAQAQSKHAVNNSGKIEVL